ncbi:uncharacterized protein LOC118754914 [Rhagoletis pomonella]|nr:uncharacterized protein LOC118754914 [Rhagoletis pomonella]
MYGRSDLASTGQSARTITSLLQESTDTTNKLTTCTKKNVQRISNSVQEQIEQLFTDVAKDATCSFPVVYLGSLSLKSKVTSLQELQGPLRELYLRDSPITKQMAGFLEICTKGLRVKLSSTPIENAKNYETTTPFHNIAVWSAVKLVISNNDGSAAFLPLITDPENIEKTSLFRPLCGTENNQVLNSGLAPIFAVVMRSAGSPKVLKCHAFICKTTEDAIVIAATLYQSLMVHVNTSSHRSCKRRAPRNQNGVSCVSTASSSVRTGSKYLSNSQALVNGRKSSFRSSSESFGAKTATPPRIGRKKRVTNGALASSNNIINEAETTTEERKRKSHKSKRAPSVPKVLHAGASSCNKSVPSTPGLKESLCDCCGSKNINHKNLRTGKAVESVYKVLEVLDARPLPITDSVGSNSNTGPHCETNGDILTRVAIPRSGSFLNTGGLTRYKSRAARCHSGKSGGGGGSPLGFSELFNEFRLHENLNSLDEILNAIIDADGMSFNDLKPIYKEFLLKLAVTLTKDELFHRSKNIMRRQRKKKLRRQNSSSIPQKKSKTAVFGTKNLKKVFHLGQFTSCRGKPIKLHIDKKVGYKNRYISETTTNQPSVTQHPNEQQQTRVATSGSDVSVVRNDNTLRGLNRNSSSGYVSCSECSYDSESCTCTSADRCYCSLRTDHINNRLCRKKDSNATLSKHLTNVDRHNTSCHSGIDNNRYSLISCNSNEKCYCSMVEQGGPSDLPGADAAISQSDSSWCDTDSCVSTSKCYCPRENRTTRSGSGEINPSKAHQDSTSGRTAAEKLALDYELFTINGNGKSVQPHEALSVKKSVEAAAIFADVKLSQTTDIKSMCPQPFLNPKPSEDTKIYSHCEKKRDSLSIDRRHNDHSAWNLSSSSSQKCRSADDILGKLRTKKGNANPESLKSTLSKGKAKQIELEMDESVHNNYPALNASLEDTLGYLP